MRWILSQHHLFQSEKLDLLMVKYLNAYPIAYCLKSSILFTITIFYLDQWELFLFQHKLFLVLAAMLSNVVQKYSMCDFNRKFAESVNWNFVQTTGHIVLCYRNSPLQTFVSRDWFSWLNTVPPLRFTVQNDTECYAGRIWLGTNLLTRVFPFMSERFIMILWVFHRRLVYGISVGWQLRNGNVLYCAHTKRIHLLISDSFIAGIALGVIVLCVTLW